MTIKYKSLKLFLAIFIIFFYIVFVGKIFYAGDLHTYSSLYESQYGISIKNIIANSYKYTSAYDPLYSLATWISSNLKIPREAFIFFSNFLLGLSVVLFFHIKKIQYIFLFLVIPNLYFLVLLTGAERLKFAYLFVIFSFLFKENSIKKRVFVLFSFFFHASMIIQVIPFIFNKLLMKLTINKLIKITFYFVVIFLISILFLQEKIKSYIGFYWKDFLFLLFISFVGYFEQYKINKSKFLIFTLPFVFMSLFINPNRITMFFVISYFYFTLTNSSKTYILPILISTYFSIIGSIYLINGYHFGHGFPIFDNFFRIING